MAVHRSCLAGKAVQTTSSEHLALCLLSRCMRVYVNVCTASWKR